MNKSFKELISFKTYQNTIHFMFYEIWEQCIRVTNNHKLFVNHYIRVYKSFLKESSFAPKLVFFQSNSIYIAFI